MSAPGRFASRVKMALPTDTPSFAKDEGVNGYWKRFKESLAQYARQVEDAFIAVEARYREGTWTPTDASGAGLSFSAVGTYTKYGRLCVVQCVVIYPATASGASAVIGGLPFTVGPTIGAVSGTYTTCGTATTAVTSSGSTVVSLVSASTSTTPITNATMSLRTVSFTLAYEVE